MRKLLKKIVLKFISKTRFYERRIEKQNNKSAYSEYLRIKKAEESKKVDINIVNLNANDICNSKCTMCNIWQQKKGFEFSAEQLNTILKDDLFKNVKHIGITGGEPTLRDDFHEISESIIDAIPTITGLSTITNCIKEKDVIERISRVIDVCDRRNKSFSMMVSLDGYKEVHDKIRGRKGNFESAYNVIKHFKEKGISIATGSTISKENVWEMDELLDFMKAENIYGRFRVAEFIKRLYNDNRDSVIRNFDKDETYNLILFFYKLIFTFEKNDTFKRTYKSIINVLSGGERLIGCPYHFNGVVLNSRGELAYCAPKSAIIGNSVQNSALELYQSHLEEKSRIINENCSKCIHDYHAPITAKEYKAELDEKYWRRRVNIDSILSRSEIQRIPKKKAFELQIFITGWYGTETVGDKAILAGIIESLEKKYKGQNVGFVISSLYPIVTERTIEELHFLNCKVIPVYSELFISSIKGSDLVIMGGGPLMDLEELALPLISFKVAKKLKIKTMIFGCGLGPLYKEKYITATKKILTLADEILLRDKKSIELANLWLRKNVEVKLSGDPAKAYLTNKLLAYKKAPKINRLSCFLREWTHEYAIDKSIEEFKALKLKLESQLSHFIKSKAIELNVDEIYLDHMHNFVIGNDDRDFSRYFIKKYFQDFKIPIIYNKKLSTVDSIVERMQTSRFNICMRFHSVVFAHTLNTEFLGFDYTNGGKIYNYLNDNKSLGNLLSINDLLEA